MRVLLVAAALFCSCPRYTSADEVAVAVAANFITPAQVLSARFEAETGHAVVLSAGSTGGLYSQIVNGAPFDLYLAADADHPARLELEGHGVQGSRMTYARGRLALWGPGRSVAGFDDLKGPAVRLAVANPRLAPYGAAALQALQATQLLPVLQDRLVIGQSVTQAHQFVASGNAPYGLVAHSQVIAEPPGSWWLVPAALHQPLDQQALLLDDTPAARAFLEFLAAPASRAFIANAGYETPEHHAR